MKLRELEHFGRSLIYNKNIKGPRIEPWGNSTMDWICDWTGFTKDNKLASIFQIVLDPVAWNSSDTAMIKFLKKDVMVKRVKRFT